jgi:hypothetical protein
VKDLVRMHHPSIFCVLETHILFSGVEKFWFSLGYKPIFLQEAHGHSGGIWVLSNSSDIVFTLLDSMRQAITFEIKMSNVSWYVSSIYASPLFANRCNLSVYLRNLRSLIHGPWILFGDFNEVLLSSEVSGGHFNLNRASLLANLMNDCNLLDIHTVGGLYTWRKNVQFGMHVRKRLDRVIADVDWQIAFPHALVEVLSQHGS